jgi:hypothetical protein
MIVMADVGLEITLGVETEGVETTGVDISDGGFSSVDVAGGIVTPTDEAGELEG